MLANMLINGLVLWGIYAVLSVGFALSFGVAKVLNMALTAYFMVTSFLIFTGISQLGVSYPVVVVLSISITILLAVVCYFLCIDPVKEQESAVLMVTFALAMLIQEIVILIYSKDYRTVPPMIPGFAEIAGIRITFQQIVAVGGSAVVLTGVWILLTKTKLGNAIRSVSQDREVAGLIGIDVSRMCMIVTAISVGLAAGGGALFCP